MDYYTVTKHRLIEGRWEGTVSRTDGSPLVDKPNLAITLDERPVRDVSMTRDEAAGTWALVVPIPAEAISDGIRTILMCDDETGALLASVALLAGEALDEDLRAEVSLLREELDMLKRAFRRHCVETR